MSTQPLLEVSDLRTTFHTSRGPVRAVDGVSFALSPGETLGIVGESGSGKSVLSRTVMDLLPPSAEVGPESQIRLEGRDIRAMRPFDRRQLWGPKIGMIFQDPMTALNPTRKIGDIIADPPRHHLGVSRSAARSSAVDLMKRVGLSDPERRLRQYPHELSGGMRQRVMIAAAISCEPQVLIADEPTTALDVTVQRQILDLLRSLQTEREMGMLLISHDLGVVARYTDQIAVMYAGRIVESGPTTAVFRRCGHRYTSALLQATPHAGLAPGSRLRPVGGSPPDLSKPVPGCAFEPRCEHSIEDCSRVAPRSIVVERQHTLSCHNPLSSAADETGGRK